MIHTEILDPAEFAPFGSVVRSGVGSVKEIRNGEAVLTKSAALMEHAALATIPALDIYDVKAQDAPLRVHTIEHHPHTAQLFCPMEAARWLVAIWPEGPGGSVRAFVAGPGDAIFYAPGVWHHGIIALDRPAKFLSYMWRSGRSDDTVFEELVDPVDISWPQEPA